MNIEERMADIPCIDCGHWLRMHGNGTGSCAACECRRFVKPKGDELAVRLIEGML